ncbi:MAG TPA: thioredoxin TrxC [Gemmatimonadaceae bacterium]|nr:thioredoxin TrxC [Gemmatimonadaceae bacterium]
MSQSPTKHATVRCPFCATLNRVDLSRISDHPKCANCGKPILLDRPITIMESDLDRIVSESDVPVIVDFYADWCGPCKAMAPLFDALARERRGEALVTKLDTDRNPGATNRFKVRGIPTMIVFSGGREVAREVGAMPRHRLDALLEQATAKSNA